MFELQRSLNPHYINLYDNAEMYLKVYPWLLDFCTYLNLERPLEKLEWYFVHAEVHWMDQLYKYQFRKEGIPDGYYTCIKDCFPEDLVPQSLKEQLMILFFHFGGDGILNVIECFFEWYAQNYKPSMPLYKMRRGRVLLGYHRLRCLEYMSQNSSFPSYEQMYSNSIAIAVDALVGSDKPVSEEDMVEALEYAESNNLMVAIVPDKGHEKDAFNCPNHIEFVKEIRQALGI